MHCLPRQKLGLGTCNAIHVRLGTMRCFLNTKGLGTMLPFPFSLQESGLCTHIECVANKKNLGTRNALVSQPQAAPWLGTPDAWGLGLTMQDFDSTN